MFLTIQNGFVPVHLTCDAGVLCIAWDDSECRYRVASDRYWDKVCAIVRPLRDSGDCDGVVVYCCDEFFDSRCHLYGQGDAREIRCSMVNVLGKDWHVPEVK